MKNTLTLIILTQISSVVFAQNPVISLTDYNGYETYTENMYIKDIDNILNPYEGTWLWTNQTDSLIVVFNKKEQVFIDLGHRKFYVDDLVAKYKYIANGVVIINTLNATKPPIQISGLKPAGNTVEFSFNDGPKEKYGEVTTVLSTNNGMTSMVFRLQNPEGPKLTLPNQPGIPWDYPFTIPHDFDFTLIKQ